MIIYLLVLIIWISLNLLYSAQNQRPSTFSYSFCILLLLMIQYKFPSFHGISEIFGFLDTQKKLFACGNHKYSQLIANLQTNSNKLSTCTSHHDTTNEKSVHNYKFSLNFHHLIYFYRNHIRHSTLIQFSKIK